MCVVCNDTGCRECGKTGRIQITCCPLEYVTDDVWEIIEYAELYEKGLPPVAGGALDQAYCFLQAVRFIFVERQNWKKILGIID